ncbi:MAG: hypothetical protein U5L95_02165 [Candidatus Saccharibacteria bacterium]|nr:hypothetical protein [Candidatus Saccharibacteria bacterium]
MEKDPHQQFQEKSATIAAKLAHAEDLLDMIDLKLDYIETKTLDLLNKNPQDDTLDE